LTATRSIGLDPPRPPAVVPCGRAPSRPRQERRVGAAGGSVFHPAVEDLLLAGENSETVGGPRARRSAASAAAVAAGSRGISTPLSRPAPWGEVGEPRFFVGDRESRARRDAGSRPAAAPGRRRPSLLVSAVVVRSSVGDPRWGSVGADLYAGFPRPGCVFASGLELVLEPHGARVFEASNAGSAAGGQPGPRAWRIGGAGVDPLVDEVGRWTPGDVDARLERPGRSRPSPGKGPASRGRGGL